MTSLDFWNMSFVKSYLKFHWSSCFNKNWHLLFLWARHVCNSYIMWTFWRHRVCLPNWRSWVRIPAMPTFQWCCNALWKCVFNLNKFFKKLRRECDVVTEVFKKGESAPQRSHLLRDKLTHTYKWTDCLQTSQEFHLSPRVELKSWASAVFFKSGNRAFVRMSARTWNWTLARLWIAIWFTK
jgi:hypothetical protein